MNFIDLLPKTQRMTGLLDPVIQSYTEEFYKTQFKVEIDQFEKRKLLSETKSIIIKFMSPVINLSEFNFMYPINGITEGLDILAIEHRNIKVPNGDYEYLKLNPFYGKNSTEPEILYISNPSSIDGNYIKNWNEILERNSSIALDAAYAGSAYQKEIKITDTVSYVFVGLSKMFGLQDLRIGYMFSRKPILSLGALLRNNYFNNNSLKLTTQLFSNFNIDYMFNKYRNVQEKICLENQIIPSDVCYIGTSFDANYNFWRKDQTNRLCLVNHILS